MGPLNPAYGKGPSEKAHALALEKNGHKIYVYDAVSLQLVNGTPFQSRRTTISSMPISGTSLKTKIDTNKAFKGYYYYSKPHSWKLYCAREFPLFLSPTPLNSW